MATLIEHRVRQLLDYLDSEPESEVALPFWFQYAIEQLRTDMRRIMPGQSLTYLQKGRLRRARAGSCTRANIR
jgi:hypothetical protein